MHLFSSGSIVSDGADLSASCLFITHLMRLSHITDEGLHPLTAPSTNALFKTLGTLMTLIFIDFHFSFLFLLNTECRPSSL